MTGQILYIFSGSRIEYRKNFCNLPDTQLFGLNHLDKFGLQAETKEFMDLCKFKTANRIISFRFKHALLFFITLKYPITFGASLIYQMPFRALFNPKTKYISLNININQILSKYRPHNFLYNILKKYISLMDGIVCLSNYQRRLLIEKHGIPKEKTIYIPLGVDISYHKYIPDENRDKFVLSVGRDKGRDYETLIECAKLTPDIDYIIVCSHQNLSRLKQKLPDNVRVFYDMSPQDLKKLYQKAQIMVLSTVDDDNINGMDCSGQTVLLDSMASGLPVIATHKRYLEDYGTHNNEIIITPTSNSLELSNAIIELQASVEKRTKLAESARKRVEKEFTTCLMAKKLAAYFKTFL